MAHKKTPAKRRPPRIVASRSTARSVGELAAGLVIISAALAAWALTFVLGGRPVINDLLHRDAGGITGFEIALAGLFAFGGIFLIGLGWSIGSRYRKT